MSNAITVDRREFARAIELATSVVDKRLGMPILGTVKVTANGALRVEGTDLDMLAAASIEYSGDEVEPFALSSPREITRALRQLGAERLSIALGGDEKRAGIVSGRFSAAIPTFPADEFPVLEPIAAAEFVAEIGQAEMAAIARIFPAISIEETRYYLNGICVEKIADWTWRFTATDGHRLMIVDVPMPGAKGAIPDRTIIPRRFVDVMLRHFARTKDAVQISYGRQRIANKPDRDLAPDAKGCPLVSISGGVGQARLELTTKTIDGTYPDYTKVIPQDFVNSVRVARADLGRAIRGLTPLAGGKVRAVRIDAIAGGLRISLHSHDIGDASIEIAAEHRLPDGLMAGFNGFYLLSCIEALRGDEVQFDLQESEAASVVIRDPADTAFLAVLMPMRV